MYDQFGRYVEDEDPYTIPSEGVLDGEIVYVVGRRASEHTRFTCRRCGDIDDVLPGNPIGYLDDDLEKPLCYLCIRYILGLRP